MTVLDDLRRVERHHRDLVEIPLTQGYVAIIDPEDAALVSQYEWRSQKGRLSVYAVTGHGKNTVRMHRLIAGTPNGVEVDHGNGDGLDNRRSNLRSATKSQNAQNRGPSSRNKTGFKGVSVYPRLGLFKVDIMVNRKSHHIGYFKSAEEGARAYDKAAIDLHGEYAWLNFPGEAS
jgi:hypothetical protein